MFRRLIFSLLIALVALGASASAALATTPGRWDPVTAANGANTDQVGLLRTPDGKLHVIWQRRIGVGTDLVQTILTADGTAGPTQTIASGWSGIGAPAIIRDDAGGLLIVAGATSSLNPGAISEIAAWRSSDGGATWTLQPTNAATGGGFAYDFAATSGADGSTPFFAWGTTFGLFVHRGTDAATPAGDFQNTAGFGCCGYDPGLALDGATGRLVVAWYSNATSHPGVFAQTVDQSSGAPGGSAALMPGSATNYSGTPRSSSTLAHTPIVGRFGKPGVFVAYPGNYPITTRVVLWRVGAARSSVLATRAAGLRNVGIAATPSGRLWAFWSANDRIYARRSSPSLASWGAVTSIPVRRGTTTTFKLAGNAQESTLDVLAAFAGSASGVQTWHSQIQPGLTLTTAPAALRMTSTRSVTLKVTDAGQPIRGASVRFGTHSATTSRSGTVRFTVGPFPRPTQIFATAAKTGYVDARTSVHVTR
jgi:hypothetical protein